MLVVDRNPVVRMVIQRTLVGEGFELGEATSSHPNILPDRLSTEVVLVEVETPEAHHLDPLRRLLARYPDVPVVGCANRAGSPRPTTTLRGSEHSRCYASPSATVHLALGLDPFAARPVAGESRSVTPAAPSP